MAVGVTDDPVVRVGPHVTVAAFARPGTRVFDMTGRPMRGWILVDGAAAAEDYTLGAWLDEGRAFAADLPPEWGTAHEERASVTHGAPPSSAREHCPPGTCARTGSLKSARSTASGVLTGNQPAVRLRPSPASGC